MKNEIDVSKLNIQYSEEINNLSVGATIYFIHEVPSFINTHKGLRQRDLSRNNYLGYTVSRPEDFRLVFGLSYEDSYDNNQHDEDYFVYDIQLNKITKYYGKELESLDPRYKKTHHKYQAHLINQI